MGCMNEDPAFATDMNETFADVRRACQRWLLKHDSGYRASYEIFKNARERGMAKEEN